MRIGKFAAAALIGVLALAGAAQAGVKVNFVQPERFSDRDFRSAAERDGILKEFERHFQRLAERHLKDGQSLRIDVLDIRLAGRYEPWQRRFHDVRILRDTTPPRFKLRYALTEGGKVLVSGEENISDMTYLWNAPARHSAGRFPYEKDMLRDWFRDRFVRMRPPRA